jgi:AcrR family transcriptional regulator
LITAPQHLVLSISLAWSHESPLPRESAPDSAAFDTYSIVLDNLSMQNLPAFESHSERRRKLLTRVASRLIETEGVDAVQMERVAEIAGCSRALVYHYFHGRQQLLAAVLDDFSSSLDARLDAAAQSKGLEALSRGSRGGAPALELLETIWDCVAECGQGGWILRSTSALDPSLRERLQPAIDDYQRRWIEPLTAGGLSELEASLVFHACSAMVTVLLARWRDGLLEREAALELGVRNVLRLIDGALGDSRNIGDTR